MGKSFVSVRDNGFDLGKVYGYLIQFEVVEASMPLYFKKKGFGFSDVSDIDLGVDGTNESIIKFHGEGFVVINKTIDTAKLKKGEV